jgi:galactokinase/mevalonate kinase-like predicted kinase
MIVTRTPFRISFFGGGTDYPDYFERFGGAVLATAIDKSLFLSATQFYSKLFDYSIRIAYTCRFARCFGVPASRPTSKSTARPNCRRPQV